MGMIMDNQDWELAYARVTAGIAFLDEFYGTEWVEHINLDDLQLESCVDCVLGQLVREIGYPAICDTEQRWGYDDYHTMVSRIRDVIDTKFMPRFYGFDSDVEHGVTYHMLDEAWSEVIQRKWREIYT